MTGGEIRANSAINVAKNWSQILRGRKFSKCSQVLLQKRWYHLVPFRINRYIRIAFLKKHAHRHVFPQKWVTWKAEISFWLYMHLCVHYISLAILLFKFEDTVGARKLKFFIIEKSPYLNPNRVHRPCTLQNSLISKVVSISVNWNQKQNPKMTREFLYSQVS